MSYQTKIPTEGSIWLNRQSVKAIGDALRVTQVGDGLETVEVRYYVASRSLSGKWFGEAVRGRWSIESLHWVLDVDFREDDSLRGKMLHDSGCDMRCPRGSQDP